MRFFKKKARCLFAIARCSKNRFIYFGRNSGLHGFNHLFKQNVTALGRLFWLSVLLASSVGVYLLAVPLMESDGGIYFAPDTRYLEWTTDFPRVTVCEQTTVKYSQQRLLELYPGIVKQLPYGQQRFITELLFGRGTCSASVCAPCGAAVPCDVPWRTIMENVHKKCSDLVTGCAYNGVEFPCCEDFLPADSERGPCFTFNALENMEQAKNPLYTVNRTTGPGELTFHILSDADITIHSNEELATKSLSVKYTFPLHVHDSTNFEILFSVVGIENDPDIVKEDINDRKCRFLNEIPNDDMHTYSVYSNGACDLAVNTKHAFEHCGCISPIRDLSYKKYYCNFTGMICLAEYEALNIKFGTAPSKDDVDCFTSCVESELNIIHVTKEKDPNVVKPGIAVRIKMAGLPTLRYLRNLLRSKLDFVVSVGGMAGLFFGASLLSIVEIFYLILRK